MKSSEALMAARDLISDKEHWTSLSYARQTSTGFALNWSHESADAFCAEGALRKVALKEDCYTLQDERLWVKAWGFLQAAVQEAFAANSPEILLPAYSPETLNDYYGHEAVMDMYDKAIRLAKEEENQIVIEP